MFTNFSKYLVNALLRDLGGLMKIYQNIGSDLRVSFHQFMEGLRRNATIIHQAGVFFESILEVFGFLRGELRLVSFLDHFFDKSVHIIIAAHFVVPADIQSSIN